MLLACRRLRLHATSSASTPAALCARLSDKAKPRSTSESRGEKLAKYNALRNATVDSLMRGPLHVTPETTVFEGVQQMVDRNIGCLLVLDENKALAGIITERDYLRKIAVLGRRSSETTVAEIMTPGQELVIVTPDCQLRECADILNENSFRHLPVMEDDGTVVGIISNRDVTTQLLKLSDAQKEYFLEYVPFDLW